MNSWEVPTTEAPARSPRWPRLKKALRSILVAATVWQPFISVDREAATTQAATHDVQVINTIEQQSRQPYFMTLSRLAVVTRSEFELLEADQESLMHQENSDSIFSQELSYWIGEDQERFDLVDTIVLLSVFLEYSRNQSIMGRDFSDSDISDLVAAAEQLYRYVVSANGSFSRDALQGLVRNSTVWPAGTGVAQPDQELLSILQGIVDTHGQTDLPVETENVTQGQDEQNRVAAEALMERINTRLEVHEFGSPEELRDWLWSAYPDINPDQVDENFVEQWLDLQQAKGGEITGIVVIPQSYLNRTLEQILLDAPDSVKERIKLSGVDASSVLVPQLEALTFSEGLDSLYRKAAEMGFISPRVGKTIVVALPDEQIKSGIASGNVSFPSYVPGEGVPSVILDGTQIQWPPGTWMIVDDHPFRQFDLIEVFYTADDGVERSFLMVTNLGWKHEQRHLSGVGDFYHYYINSEDYYLRADLTAVKLKDLAKGWSGGNYQVRTATFAIFDNMHEAQSLDTSAAGAVQTAIYELNQRDQWVYYKEPRETPFSVTVTGSDGATLFGPQDALVSVGAPVSPEEAATRRRYQAESETSVAEFVPNPTTQAGSFFAPETNMYLAQIQTSQGEFSLPIPNLFWLWQKMARPDNFDPSNEPVKLDIHMVGDFGQKIRTVVARELAWYQPDAEIIDLTINVDLMTLSQLNWWLEQDSASVIATAGLPVDQRLYSQSQGPLYLVWQLLPARVTDIRTQSISIGQ